MLFSPQILVAPRKPTAAWTPAQLPSLLAWYSADSGVYKDAGTTLASSTDTVQQWNDKSGNGYHLKQSTAGSRPQYLSGGFNSKQTVKFTAATPTGMLTDQSVNLGSGTNSSGFFVGQMLTGTASGGRAVAATPTAVDSNANAMIWGVRDATNNNIYSYRGGIVGTQAVSLATNYRFGVVYDGVNGTTYLNNANAQATANTNTFDGSGAVAVIAVGINIAADRIFGTVGWDGPISEVVLTLGALSTGDRNSLDAYFQSHWGL
jgi:hypothetical protein